MITKPKTINESSTIWRLLQLMEEKNASDLFLTMGKPPTYKIDGALRSFFIQELNEEDITDLINEVITDEHQQALAQELEANFALTDPEIGRFRFNIFQQQNHYGMVIRRINTHIPDMEELGLPTALEKLSTAKRGLILFVGATGSGKSTSLASIIDHCNRHRDAHIVTIEDPVEFIHQHKRSIITQREVGIDTKSFDNALINTLRQAPDIIVIGEIRNKETMEHAIAFSETGHLVFATLHANNANQALDRIINFFPVEKHNQLLLDLSLNLKAILAQRLIPSVSGKGRCLASEVLINTPYIASSIQKGDISSIKEAIKQGQQYQMQSFDQALYQLYRQGKISADDALLHADSANEVRLMIKLDEAEDPESRNKAIEGLSLQSKF